MGWFIVSLVVSLIGSLLFVDCLLRENNITDLQKGIQLDSGFGNHIIDFHDSRKCGHGRTRALRVVHSVAISARKVTQDSARRGNLSHVSGLFPVVSCSLLTSFKADSKS